MKVWGLLDSEDYPIPTIFLLKFKISARGIDVSISNITELISNFNESMFAMSHLEQIEGLAII